MCRPAWLAVCLALAWCLPAFAADVQSPTTAPSDSKYSALIDQLGDEDYSVRESASGKLLAAGDQARPALEKAAASDNPEVRWRAQALLKRMSVSPMPGEAPPGTLGVQRGLSFSSSVQNGMRITQMTANGRTVEIEQGTAGITMTVRGWLDGKPDTEHFQARDPDALRELSPQAYALWQQLGSGTGQLMLGRGFVGGPIFVRGGALIVGGPPQLVVAPPQIDDLTTLRNNLAGQMDQAKLRPDQRKQILDELQHVQAERDAIGLAPNAMPADARKLQDAYLSSCDDLRKQLAALKLPDPGAALPPPAWARLGVTIGQLGVLDGVGQIASVEDGSRGQKLGLQPGDIVLRINGTPTRTISDLRNAVTANRQLVVSVIRNGQMISLREAAPVAAPQ